MKIDDIKNSMGGSPEEEDEDDDDLILVEEDMVLRCERLESGEDCQYFGNCIQFKFNEGTFNVCNSLIIEDIDEEDNGAVMFDGEDN